MYKNFGGNVSSVAVCKLGRPLAKVSKKLEGLNGSCTEYDSSVQ